MNDDTFFMNQTAMDDPNVIVLMNVSGNTTPKQRPSDTTKNSTISDKIDLAGSEGFKRHGSRYTKPQLDPVVSHVWSRLERVGFKPTSIFGLMARVQNHHSGPHEEVEECAFVGNTGHFDNDRLGLLRGLGKDENRHGKSFSSSPLVTV